jgi:hypothetical protein
MATDLSYILLNPNDSYIKMRIGEEIETFDGEFLILNSNSNVRVILIHPLDGFISGIHYLISNGIPNVQGMYTSPKYSNKGLMKKVLNYANTINGRLNIGNDLTTCGEHFVKSLKKIKDNSFKYIQNNTPEHNEYHLQLTLRNKLASKIKSLKLPHGRANKKNISIIKEKMKALKVDLKNYDDIILPNLKNKITEFTLY